MSFYLTSKVLCTWQNIKNSFESNIVNSVWEYSFIHDKIKENESEFITLSFKISVKQNSFCQLKHCTP